MDENTDKDIAQNLDQSIQKTDDIVVNSVTDNITDNNNPNPLPSKITNNKNKIVVAIAVLLIVGISALMFVAVGMQDKSVKSNSNVVANSEDEKKNDDEVVLPNLEKVDKVPELVTLLSKGWKHVAANSGTTCAIATNDQIYCWGSNSIGQTGNIDTVPSPTARQVDISGILKDKKFQSITAGMGHFCAIADDNNAYCWGGSNNGSLGDGAKISSGGWVVSEPVAVDTSGVLKGKTIKSITAGSFHTCAIASDDNAYCWGYNTWGQLGDATEKTVSVPVAVNTSGALNGKTIKSIAAGESYTCAIASDDKVYCWGKNWYNQLGQGIPEGGISTTPTAVDTKGVLNGKTILSISAGSNFTCVITSEYKTYCWG
jgi:alpha-tubulin suppressor-like RCC1 family protein